MKQRFIPRGNIKRIHVDQHVIRHNKKTGDTLPPITVQMSQGSVKAHRISLPDGCEVIYRPDKPLSCGARLWIETKGGVLLHE